jgi:voltage-gated potassium channel
VSSATPRKEEGKLSKARSRIRVQVAAAASSLLALVLAGTVAFRLLEGWTWIQSFYFSVVTLSTVGYGDLHPTSDVTRLFTALFILAGVGIVLASLTVIGTSLLARREERILRRRSNEPGGRTS